MIHFLASIIVASLLFPVGFGDGQSGSFLIDRAVDFSYASPLVPLTGGPERMINTSLGIQTSARNILIIDRDSNSPLYQKNSQQVVPIASITKLLTALVFLDYNPGWDQTVVMTADDRREGGLVSLLPNEVATVRDLFYAMLISSTNEAAVALARSTGIENFVGAMNQKALDLGMVDSNFVDVTGLSPANLSSAADLVLLAQAAFGQPEIVAAVTTEIYPFTTTNTQRQVMVRSTDQLLDSFLNRSPYEIVGAKTGFLDEAGYCLLLIVRREDGTSLMLVLLGAADQTSRWQEAKGLVDWVYDNYRWL